MPLSFRAVRIAAVYALAASLAGACKEDGEDAAEVVARWTLSPDGGSYEGGPVTLELPQGAITAEQEVELRKSATNLSAADYVQVGDAYDFSEPLLFRLPARLTIGGEAAAPVVLFSQDGLTVTSDASSAYINELGTIALAEAGTPLVTGLMPAFGATPGEAGMALRDSAHMSLTVTSTPELNLALTIYDTTDYYAKPLNGTGEGDCGFKLENVLGGSLSAGCSEGPLTASIGVSSAQVDFDVVPFLAGKMESPVVVGVVAGGELAHMLGFFAFDTSLCFEETCSGYGTCMENGSDAVCQCIDGYAANGLECNCVPQCDGRECGGDSCGGSCAPDDCGDGAYCDDASGQCVPDGSDTGSDTTDGGGSESTGGGNESSGGGGSTSGMGSTGGGSGSSGSG